MIRRLASRVEHWLSRLDEIIRTRNSRERYMIYLLPVFLIGFISYEYLTPGAKQVNDAISLRLVQVQNTIAEYEGKISAKTGERGQPYLKRLEDENAQLKHKIAALKDTALYIQAKTEALDFLYFDTRNWSAFIHQLVGYSTRNDVVVRTFKNTRYLGEERVGFGGFQRVMTLDVNASGSFADISGFIRDIENDTSLTGIDTLQIIGGSRLSASMQVSKWGILR